MSDTTQQMSLEDLRESIERAPGSPDEIPLDYRLWLDRQLYGNSYERVSMVPCEPCHTNPQIGDCPRCHNTRFVEVRERIDPRMVIVRMEGD